MVNTVENVKYPEINPESSRVVRPGKALYGFNCSQGFLFGGSVMRGRFNDLTGRKFGRLTVIRRVFPNAKHGHAMWECQCSCGQIKTILGHMLKSGKTKSCGCLKIELQTTHGEGFSHGKKPTKEYRAWQDMKQRCSNPNNLAYKHYGMRGIKVCDRWINSYENFIEDMGRCPSGLTLERKDNNGNYEPRNCKWATWNDQNRNHRRNRMVSYNKKTQCLRDWSKQLKIHYNTLAARLDLYGMSIEEAFTRKVRRRNPSC